MREDLLKETELELQEIRRRNEETEQARRREIFLGYPEIRELMEKRENLIQSAISGILKGNQAAEDLPAMMDQVSAEIREKLTGNAFPADYLSPVYDCPICRDTGFVGEVVRERCECVRKRYQEKLRRAIGLPETGEETFERYDPLVFPDEKLPGKEQTQRQSMEMVRSWCEKWTEAYPNQKPRDLVLSGKSGLGKTFLLHAMANRLISRGVSVLMVSAYSFLETARKAWFDQDEGLSDLIGSEVLMLDDLGSEPLMQNITVEQLFNLINERQRRNLATVISTNLNGDELKNRYTERIASRLTDRRNALFLPLQGRDIRNGRAG